MPKRSWRSTVADWIRPRAANSLEEMSLETAVQRGVEGARADAGVIVTVDTAQSFAAVASCVRVLSDDIAHLPLVTFQRQGPRVLPALADPVYKLLKDRPNEWQSSFDWRKLMQRDLLFRGVAYSMIIRGFRDQPMELIRLHPDRTKARQDATSLAVSYEYLRADGRRVTLQSRDIFVVRYATDDGVLPLSPISLYRDTVGDGIALRKHGSTFFSNGAKPLGALQSAGKMSTDGKAEMRADFEKLYSGPDNAHRVAILDQGVKYEPISISMEDSQYVEARKFNRSEIAGIFGVPPHKIGDLDKATFANIEHQGLEYVIGSLTPWLVNWEQAIKRDLLDGDDSRFAKFNVDALLRGDAKSRAEALQIQRRNGVINANEWRALQDMNPREDPGGDVYIVESNMSPNAQRGGETAP